MKNKNTRAFKVAVGILLVKDRIHQFYAQTASLERGLNEFKRKHGYCSGRPFCMNPIPEGKTSCSECLKANANPKYKKKVSEYGKLRAIEKKEEREGKKVQTKPRAKLKAA
jgi:hypothetical protein